MGKKRLLALMCMIFLVFSYTSSAAVIYGKVYDFGLEEVDDAVVEISTLPQQKYVAKNSTYTFTVEPGKYVLSAKQYKNDLVVASADEQLEIMGDGEYVMDLILFPSFEEEEEILGEAEFDIETDFLVEEGPGQISILILALAIIALFILYIKLKKKAKKIEEKIEGKKEPESDELKEVIDFIKEEGGRTTQREIRSNFPQSEAKISLIISELEDKGKIRKIKKGRGNIIILNK